MMVRPDAIFKLEDAVAVLLRAGGIHGRAKPKRSVGRFECRPPIHAPGKFLVNRARPFLAVESRRRRRVFVTARRPDFSAPRAEQRDRRIDQSILSAITD